MDSYYGTHSPLARRATVPITLAPTAPMIDPNLEHHGIQHTQLMQPYDGHQMPNQVQNNHLAAPNRVCHSQTVPVERVLPSKEVSDQTMDEAYIQFILYCNPSISADVDTTELRKNFRTPPKSDGKTFSSFALFGLIARLENKDIKTWTELVIELGVELPDPERNQSTQKVQQYAVRLKRWLHAFHIDAFFNYLVDKPNVYLTQRPTREEPLASITRDGIAPEDDLAIRALLPEWRPKRGRRKAEEVEPDADANAANKKPRVQSNSADLASMFEDQYSAAPSSAVPWNAQANHADPWAAAHVAIAPKTPATSQTPTASQLSAQGPAQQMRWRFNNHDTPSSPYPQSAITPRQSFIASFSFDETKSAHPSTASKPSSLSRRRNGPAVSSAWRSTATNASGKIRGRPPSNRSAQDGPFSTFPANPSAKDTSAAVSIATPTASPEPGPETHLQPENNPTLSPQAIPPNHHPTIRKPSKLQLQVPAHAGGPVRLATPPRVVINGESSNGRTPPRRSSADFFSSLDGISEDEVEDVEVEVEGGGIDWKRRAMALKRKLVEKEEELRVVRRRVLEAVM